MIVWRLCNPRHADTAMQGTGSALAGGRWNTKGTHMVYTASTLSLALLEMAVQTNGLVTPLAAFRVDVPDALILAPAPGELPTGWQQNRRIAQHYGEAWFAARKSVALRVPSVVVPRELNLLINPEHPDFARLTVERIEDMTVDERLI